VTTLRALCALVRHRLLSRGILCAHVAYDRLVPHHDVSEVVPWARWIATFRIEHQCQ